jgi:hypothetical protein
MEKEPLSKRPLGYLISLAGSTVSPPLTIILSPLFLFLLNLSLKKTGRREPNRFAVWFIVMFIIYPVYFTHHTTGIKLIDNYIEDARANLPWMKSK